MMTASRWALASPSLAVRPPKKKRRHEHLDFRLITFYNHGLSYSTINTARSAISFIVTMDSGKHLVLTPWRHDSSKAFENSENLDSNTTIFGMFLKLQLTSTRRPFIKVLNIEDSHDARAKLVLRLLRYTIGLKNSRQFFIQSEVKAKPIVTHSHAFSRVLRQLPVITSKSYWFTVLCVFFVIG